MVGDPEIVARALARLAGSCVRFQKEFSVDAVIAQAKSFDREAGSMDDLFDNLQLIGSTHPDPIRRIREIYRWSESEDLSLIRQRLYLTRAEYEFRNKPVPEGVAV